MTKDRKWLRLLLLSGIFATGYACTEKDNHAGNLAVVFVPQIEGSVSTRAVDSQWSEDDRVGICMINAGETLSAESVFSQYRVSSGGAAVGLLPVNTHEALSYPVKGSEVNFVAFSPYTSIENNAVTYSGFADQSTLEKIEAINFLYHRGTVPYNKHSRFATLPFSHKLSKLVIKATTVSTIEAVTLSSMDITITGTPGSLTANLSNGSLTTGSVEDITPLHSDENSGNTRVAQALIVPHAGISGRTIRFSVPESTHDYILPLNNAFQSGYTYTLEFNVTRQGVTLSNTSIENWVDDDSTWNKEYTLNIPQSSVTIPATAGKRSVMFKTNYSGTVTTKFSTSAEDADAGMPVWITPVSPLLTIQDEEHTCSFTTEASEGISRSFYIHVTAGTLSKVVQVTQNAFEEPSNTYILVPGRTIYIPVSRANDHGRGTIGTSTAFTADLIWMDTPGLLTTLEPFGTGVDGAIKVTATDKVGNAVIAVKVNDEIKWSWHIWVTDYVPDATQNNGWMDRNLGATSSIKSTIMSNRVKTFGLLYQWGRKDPFPGSVSDENSKGAEPMIYTSLSNPGSEYDIQTESAEQTISWTVAHPDVFITKDDAWMSGSSAEDRNWNGTGDTKTIYDPCPAGWRVPLSGSWGSSSNWSAWDKITKGCDAVKHGGWYPAVGHRNTSGELDAVGVEGRYWGANSNPKNVTKAAALYFSSDDYTSAYYYSRTSGLTVRCTAE